MKEFQLEIITPAKAAYEGKVISVTVPGSAGEFQVLFNHAPLMSTLEVGKIKIVDAAEKEIIFATSGGVVEVRANKVLVLADSLERRDEIDVNRAEKAAERAKERLGNRADKSIDFLRAEIALTKAINRIKIGG